MGHLSLGYAAVTLPVSSAAIQTDVDGLDAKEVQIPVQNERMPAYQARPLGKSVSPVILVVQEIFGVHEHIKDVCRRLAREGYCAIAPELYFRQGDVSALSDLTEIIGKVVSKVPDAQVMADLDAAVEYVRESQVGDLSRLGITGFCWGGRITWLYCAHQSQTKAGVAWYGRLEAGPYSGVLTPHQPVDIAGNLQVPVLGLYGGKDESIPPESVERMRKALRSAGKNDCEIVVYPEAGHAFYADYRPSYHELSARDGWRRLLNWFVAAGVK